MDSLFTVILSRGAALLLAFTLLTPGTLRAQAGSGGALAVGAASAAFECKGKAARAVLENALKEVQTKYQKLSGVAADFYQDSYLVALDASESSRGKVVFSKPGRMKWRYLEPEQQEFVLKDNTVWLYQPEIQQVLIDELSEVLITDLPVAFLMGVGDLSQGFKLAGGCEGSSGLLLELEPRKSASKSDREESLKRFTLLVSSERFPAGARVLDVVGNMTTILLRSIKENPVISESEFLIEYPSGTDVNDRRIASKG